MNPVRLRSEGAAAGKLFLPAFQLRSGELLCLHLPAPSESTDEDHLVRVLTGKQSVPGVTLLGHVDYAEPPTSRAGLGSLFRAVRVGDWLRRNGRLPQAEADAVVRRLGLQPDWPVATLARNARVFLGLEAAWSRGAEAVVFSTTGCDPLGVQAVYDAVASRLSQCPAIHLSHPFVQNGETRRDCFPGATCIEVRRVSDSPVPSTRI